MQTSDEISAFLEAKLPYEDGELRLSVTDGRHYAQARRVNFVLSLDVAISSFH